MDKWCRVRVGLGLGPGDAVLPSFLFTFSPPKFAYVHGDHMQFRVLLQMVCHTNADRPHQ